MANLQGPRILAIIREEKLWDKIRRAAKTNPALQLALDRAIIIYHLSNNT